MDVFAHGLWTGAVYKAGKKETRKPLHTVFAVFWGIFPDLFAFTPAFVFLFYQSIFGGKGFAMLRPHADFESATAAHQVPLYDLSNSLYNASHSLIIFLIVFALVWAILKRPVWELGGWLIHILVDIPTHSYAFFPTPFLWPLSDFKVNGISWGVGWFMALNYGSLLVLYIVLARPGLKRPLRAAFAILLLVLMSAYLASRVT
ncbi:MAG: hypothetical protein WC835_01770 [Candidatus Paceibacterota bacterium]|jgi:hypothetical protein